MNKMMKNQGKGIQFIVALAVITLFCFPVVSEAVDDISVKYNNNLINHRDNAVKGKKVVYLAFGFDSPIWWQWYNGMKIEADRLGMDFEVRDCNYKAEVQSQIMEAMIQERPDVIIAQNIAPQLLAKQIRRAEKAGIYVIQFVQMGEFMSSGYVGVNWWEPGELGGEEIIKLCGKGSGKSGKIAILHGDRNNSAANVEIAALKEIVKKDPHIKIVAQQDMQWNPAKGYDLMNTIIQQHPDLCAAWCEFTVWAVGPAKAVKDAGKDAKILCVTNGDAMTCENMKNGNFSITFRWDPVREGEMAIATAAMLLQSGVKPGSIQVVNFTPLFRETKDDYQPCAEVPVPDVVKK